MVEGRNRCQVAGIALLGNLLCLGCTVADVTGTDEAALVGGIPTFGSSRPSAIPP
jgi:hypothetical protein